MLTMNITIDDQRILQKIIFLKDYAIKRGFTAENLNCDNLTGQKVPITLPIDSLQGIVSIYTKNGNRNILFPKNLSDTSVSYLIGVLGGIYMYMLDSEKKLDNKENDTINERILAAFFALPLINLYIERLNNLSNLLAHEKKERLSEKESSNKKIKERNEQIDYLYNLLKCSACLIGSLSGVILYLLLYKNSNN
jgi:hypothetical protein